jgi:branched-chain amino acid transport system permease protein
MISGAATAALVELEPAGDHRRAAMYAGLAQAGGSALGPLAAGIVIGVSEAVTMAIASPSWAPIVSFSLLIAMLLLRPGKAA